MSKVKNVIKGCLSYHDIDIINIISITKTSVLFCGTLEKYQNPPDYVYFEKRRIDDLEVIKHECPIHNRLDIFVNETENNEHL